MTNAIYCKKFKKALNLLEAIEFCNEKCGTKVADVMKRKCPDMKVYEVVRK